ncbi:murein DD-endopeptidase MepM/ murein hydrolase activator NlpD [Sphingomonas naasensis]|uniref:M23 family metallopeptidase n=1 Tax=Sphingomonas naasensis TaxID=1344951 RepID=A0A4S1WAV8_9SPHN|nr:M23 family metallopeptidase [Sphingomonas naasensis]NIJ19805.1 murein DD-endopeptidase MepM/ murein hydrolase activator NlpD [Sphingomonas naasensis]TGX40061.1 M23 family metallopeptidase [Sphingomonas naasensis]
MMRARRVAALVLALAFCGPAQSRDPRPDDVQAAANPLALVGQTVQGGLVIGTAPRGATLLTLDGVAVPLAPDRRFLIAFDRDAAPSALLVARMANGAETRQRIAVAPRAWNISRLDRLAKYPVPLPEFERVRPGELAQINAARALRSESGGWRQRFLWPVTGRISTLFGSQRIYAGEPGAYHSGIDIVRSTGTVVLAPADGVVTLATPRPFTLEGNLLLVDHGMGLNSAFAHLSRIDVKPGERVYRGQPIGLVGRSGRVTGAHLHWGLRWRDARLDPLLLAGPMPVAVE